MHGHQQDMGTEKMTFPQLVILPQCKGATSTVMICTWKVEHTDNRTRHVEIAQLFTLTKDRKVQCKILVLKVLPHLYVAPI